MASVESSLLSRIKSIILAAEPSARIYLYGSRSRGVAGKLADWDLLILIERDSIPYEVERQITAPLYDLEFETGELISPLIYTESDWINKYSITPFFHNVMKEGRLI